MKRKYYNPYSNPLKDDLDFTARYDPTSVIQDINSLTESEYKSFTAWIGYELENNAGIYDRIAYEELVFIKQRLRKEG